MVLGHRKENTSNCGLVEDIKRDIAGTLKKKGVNVSSVDIVMKSGNINLSLCINKEDASDILSNSSY